MSTRCGLDEINPPNFRLRGAEYCGSTIRNLHAFCLPLPADLSIKSKRTSVDLGVRRTEVAGRGEISDGLRHGCGGARPTGHQA